jgi:hypothetical protein
MGFFATSWSYGSNWNRSCQPIREASMLAKGWRLVKKVRGIHPGTRVNPCDLQQFPLVCTGYAPLIKGSLLLTLL